MGKLEEESKKRAQKENIQKIVLATIKIAGLLSVGLVAPNIIGALDKLGIIENNRSHRVNRSVYTLKKNGLIKFEKTKNGTFVRLTPSGEHRLNTVYERGSLPRPPKWDGKWRIVIFDINEKKRRTRHLLRKSIEIAGFHQLQKSVWVYPYDCEDFIILLKADFKIGKDLLYIIADKIEYDAPLRKIFDLPV